MQDVLVSFVCLNVEIHGGVMEYRPFKNVKILHFGRPLCVQSSLVQIWKVRMYKPPKYVLTMINGPFPNIRLVDWFHRIFIDSTALKSVLKLRFDCFDSERHRDHPVGEGERGAAAGLL